MLENSRIEIDEDNRIIYFKEMHVRGAHIKHVKAGKRSVYDLTMDSLLTSFYDKWKGWLLDRGYSAVLKLGDKKVILWVNGTNPKP